MLFWRHDPAILMKILAHEAGQNLPLRRRMAIMDVLTRRGITPWQDLVHTVEEEVGAGAYGESPQTRLWADLRALREAGIMIGYSRRKGHTGYFLRAESIGEPASSAFAQVFRELDLEHLDRMAEIPGWRKMRAAMELSEFGRKISERGRQKRESRRGTCSLQQCG